MNIYENPVFARIGNSTYQRIKPLFRPETVPAANSCSRMKFMHIKFISYKKKFVGPTRSNILLWEVCSRTDFLAKFLALFEKAAGRGRCIVTGHTPKSRGINIYIKTASHNNIERLGVSKNFWRKKGICFWTSFFFTFSSEIFLWTNPHFFSKKKVKIWLEKQHVFFLFDPH